MSGVKKLGFEESLKKATILNLKRLSPESVKSKHAVIAISGFLTEDVDKKESWRHIVNHYNKAEVYALNWNSLSVSTIFKEGYYKDKKKKNFLKKTF
jgi:hypothetical protein